MLRRFADDLPVIRENVRKGFLETQTKVNKWINDFRKRIDGEDEDDPTLANNPQRRDFGPSQSDQMYGIRTSAERARRSGDRERYDADNRVIGDDFERLELRDTEGAVASRPQPLDAQDRRMVYGADAYPAMTAPMRSSSRPLANPDLFNPSGPPPPQSGPVDEVDALYREPTPTDRKTSSSKTNKWQPLTSVAPNPESEDNDPFSLGDSDDERETNKQKDINPEATERLKRASASAQVAEGGGSSEGSVTAQGAGRKSLQPAERSGSLGQKDRDMEKLLEKS